MHLIKSRQFVKLTEEGNLKPRLPRYSEGETRRLLETLGDDKRFLASRKFSTHDLDNLLNMCDSANRIASMYYSAGIAAIPITGATAAALAHTYDLMRKRNSLKYQDELAPLTSFSLKCWAKALPVIVEFIKTLKPEEFDSTRQQGVIKIRRGVLKGYLGLAEAYTATSTSVNNRRRLINTMAEVSEVYSQALDLSSRQHVRHYLLSSQSTMPREFSIQYSKILKAMSSDKCENLCLL